MIYQLSQYFCYLAGIGFLIAALMKRSQMALTEVESFLSLLLIVCGTLLLISIGMLGGLAGRLEGRRI